MVCTTGKLVSENQLVEHFALEETLMRSKHTHGLIVLGELCTLIDAKDKGAVTGSAPTYRSVCHWIDTSCPHSQKHSRAKHVVAWGVFSNPVVDSSHSRVPHETGALPCMSCAWSTPFACQMTLPGALCTPA